MMKYQPFDREQEGAKEDSRLLDQANLLMREAVRAGASQAEVYLKKSRTTEVCLGGVTDQSSQGQESGGALRVWDENGRLGHATSTLQRIQGGSLVHDALAGLRLAGAGGSHPVEPAPSSGEPSPSCSEFSTVGEWDAQEKRESLLSALDAAREDGGTVLARYREAKIQVAICNSRGISDCYRKTLSLMILAPGEGSGWRPSMEWVGAGSDVRAMTQLVREFGQLKVAEEVIQVQPTSLLLRPSAAVTLIQLLAAELITDPRTEGGPEDSPAEAGERSLLRLGSPEVTVVDDGLLPDGPGSAPFDGEGAPAGRLMLMKSGIRLDRLRRRRAGDRDRPGSMQRASYLDPPAPSGTNFFILAGPRSAPSVRQQMNRGYELAFLRPAPGRVQHSAQRWWQGAGWEVRDGLRQGACRRLAFRCSSACLLEGVREVADRPRFYPWRSFFTGSPDLRIQLDG